MEKEVLTVSNDKRSVIENQISNWMKQKSKNRIKNFGKQIEYKEIQDTDLYFINLKIRYCRREFLMGRTMPYSGEEINPGRVLDLWAYKTDGQNQENKDVLESDLSDESIEAWLKENITSRFINFSIETRRTGIKTENASVYPLEETYELSVCPECIGDGILICKSCNGSGKKPCYYCDGRKKVSTYSGIEKCTHCSGTGYEICSDCNGAKKYICRTCDGKKKVIKYNALQEFFTIDEQNYKHNEFISPELADEILDNAETNEICNLELDQNNINSVLESNELLRNNTELYETVRSIIEEIGNDLEENQRINKLEIKISKISTTYVAYRFEDADYELALIDNNYEIIAIEEKLKAIISQKRRLTLLLLCLFFGFFGIHRFYVGKPVTAILQLLLCPMYGIGVIWVFIDFILICIGKFKDKNGKKIVAW